MTLHRNLFEIVSRITKNIPNKIAIEHEGKGISYKEFLTEYLGEMPFKRGDRVLILMENNIQSLVNLFRALRCEAIPALVSASLPNDKLNDVINEFMPSVIMHNDKRVPNFFGKEKYPQELNSNTAFLLYTSGSTGSPKGVICTHRAVLAAIDSIDNYLEFDYKDRTAVALPLSHGYGLYQVFCTFSVGGTIKLLPSITSLNKFFAEMDEFKPTGLAVVPTMLSMMFRAKDWTKHLKSLRYLTNAGDALPPPYYEALIQELPNTQIIPMHGLTECVRTLYLPGFYKERYKKGQRIPTGIPIPGVSTYLKDEEGNDLPENAIGELFISGDNVMGGYYNKPEQTTETFVRHGDKVLLATGDLFYKNKGLYYFVSRKSDMVKIRGEKVYPKEVEKVIYSVYNVDEVAVVSKPDEKQGHILVAHVTGDVLERDIKKVVKNRLGMMYVPQVVKHDKLPKNVNGKIDRKALERL